MPTTGREKRVIQEMKGRGCWERDIDEDTCNVPGSLSGQVLRHRVPVSSFYYISSLSKQNVSKTFTFKRHELFTIYV